MRHLLRAGVVVLLLVLVAGTNVHAAVFLFADITHDQETVQGPFITMDGRPRPESFGNASFVINDAMTELTFTATIFNIDVTGTQTPTDTNDNLVAAHIHAAAPPGTNASVRWGFFGAPDNDTNPDDLVIVPFATGVGGTFTSKWDAAEGNGGTTLAAQLPAILAGQSYINFHTAQFTGGEIRGQIIPEPATIGLLALGAAVLLRRRSHA